MTWSQKTVKGKPRKLISARIGQVGSDIVFSAPDSAPDRAEIIFQNWVQIGLSKLRWPKISPLSMFGIICVNNSFIASVVQVKQEFIGYRGFIKLIFHKKLGYKFLMLNLIRYIRCQFQFFNPFTNCPNVMPSLIWSPVMPGWPAILNVIIS